MINKLYILFFCTILFCLFTFSTDNNSEFPSSTKAYIIGQSKILQVSLDNLINKINEKDSIINDKKDIIELFRKARFHYKKIEFIADYLMEDVFKIPLILDEKRQFTTEEFSVSILIELESMLSEDKISKFELKQLVKKMQAQNLQFYQYMADEILTKTSVFEAMKYNLIRIETLNITDFDCETTLNSTQDIIANLQSIDTILAFINSSESMQIQKQIKLLRLKIKNANAYLSQHNFYTINRLQLIKKHIQPIHKMFSQLIELMKVGYLEDLYKIKRAVLLPISNIYNPKFIQTTFYSDDKYRNITAKEIELGKKLFFDKNLSNDKTMSCATCHQPQKFFTDGLPTAITNKSGVFQRRNTPSILNSAFQNNFFYDMRAKSFEQQVSHVVHNIEEFNTNYDTIIARLNCDTNYVRSFQSIYPYHQPINAATINAALAAFQHSLVSLNSLFDKYMRSEISKISLNIENGFNLFMGKAKCGTCHFAPTFYGNVPPFFAEMESEVLSIPFVWDTLNYVVDNDLGRYEIIKFDIFKNAFKTPTVRNVSHTAPYMHNGSFKTLEDVLSFYNIGGASAVGKALINQTLSDKKLNLTKKEIKDIIAFMNALTDSTYIKM